MLKKDKTDKRVERHSVTQEDFTPKEIVDKLLANVDEKVFKDFTKTFLDTSCGTGNILLEILSIRLGYTSNVEDAINALKTIYGIELMADNVECVRQRLYDKMIEHYPQIKHDVLLNFKVRAIIRNRIQWHDSLTFDFNNWPKQSYKPCCKHETIGFKVIKAHNDKSYPMWDKKYHKN